MDLVKSPQQFQDLVTRHLVNSESALNRLPHDDAPRLVIWPESPMNFSYGTDALFRDLVGGFAKQHHTAVLFNSQEPAPDNGFYNSALLINEEGRLIAQYDKIRLMPFGEYVPLPRWLPGTNQVRAIVGEFTPGTRYTLMPLGKLQAGVFICIESAYPQIARTFTAEGADVLINISNDGYLGETAVMRQHLGNAIFRAVENERPLLRVTNTGITAYIAANGSVSDETPGFQTAVRTWTVTQAGNTRTFYTRHGALFIGTCAALTLFVFVLTFTRAGKTKPVSHTRDQGLV
jgi:apolipoprotein N-acyltransferase